MALDDAARDTELTVSPQVLKVNQAGGWSMGQAAHRGGERPPDALNHARPTPPLAAPDTSLPQRCLDRSAPADGQPEHLPLFPRQFSKVPASDACGDPYPKWLEQVIHEQEALLRPTQSIAPPALSQGASGTQEIGYYHAWLDYESQRRASHYFKSSWREFAEHIRQTSHATNGQATLSFTSLPPIRSASTTLTRGQVLAFSLLLLSVVAGLYLAGPATLTLLLGGATLAYLTNLTLTATMAAHIIGHAPKEQVTSDLLRQLDDVLWPPYTVLCPLYREVAVVPQFVAAMRALDYPQDRLQVLFLTESDDDVTREAIHSMHLPPHFEVVTVPDGQPRTKPRACNYGLLLARGSFVVIYDAEDVPDPLQLKKAVLAFASHSPSLACVQARLGFYNTRQNLLTRWFAIEYALWFSMILPGLQWARLSLPLGGTSNHFRTDILRRLGGWDAFNMTEDCDLGLRLAEHHLHTAILDSTTLEEANASVHNWIRQRSRWIKGYMQTYLVHSRRPWDYISRGRIREMFSLLAIIGGTPATFLVNPLMWALLGLYIARQQALAPEFHLLYSAPIFYPAIICLVGGNFLYLYMYLVACAKSEQFHLLPWVLTIPVCWTLMCAAAAMALFQLVVKPHYWEKTHHGLYLSWHPTAIAVAGTTERPPTSSATTTSGAGTPSGV